jgi:two-component system CheB/CheR fusion protein
MALNVVSLAAGATPEWAIFVAFYAVIFGGGVFLSVRILTGVALVTWLALGLAFARAPSAAVGWIVALGAVATGLVFVLSGFYRRLVQELDQLRLRGLHERAELQQQRSASQQSLQRIAENASDVIYRYRYLPERGFEYVNPATTRLLGYAPEEFYADPEFNRVIIHPDDYEAFDAADHVDREVTLTARYVTKDGRIVWLSHKPVPVWEDGRIVAVEGIARVVSEEKELEASLRAEIEERKQIERALIEIAEGVSTAIGDEFFRSLVMQVAKTLGTAYAAVGTLEPGSILRSVAMLQQGRFVTGYREPSEGTLTGEVLGQGFVFYGDDALKHVPGNTEGAALGVVSFAGTVLKDSGGKVVGVISVADTKPLVKRTLVEAVLKVYGARAAAEFERQAGVDALRVSEERLRHALDAARMGSWWWDLGTNKVVWDDVVHELFGVRRGAFDGTFEQYMSFIYPDDRATQAAHIEVASRTKEPLVSEHRVVRDGQVAWLRGQGRMLSDAAGRPIGMYGICQDVTERKNIEALLQQAKETAESANRVKEAILTNLSHEIRSPLTSVLGFADLLARQFKGSEHERYVTTIQKGSLRMLSLLDGLLDYAQIEGGRLALNPVPHSVRRSAERAAGLVHAAAAAKGLAVDVTSEGDPYSVCDPLREEEIFEHILDNAVRFSDRGRIVLAVREEAGPRPFVVVTVSDEGRGMAPEFVPQAFTEFSQESPGEAAGSGLGLSIVKKLVVKMGGDVALASRPGAGTTVTVRIPAAFEAARVTVPAQDGQARPAVLVVEDDPDCLELFRDTLSSVFELTLCETGEAALAQAERRGFDLLVLDIQLRGGIDGLETIRRLRERPTLRGTPALALTGFAMQGDSERILAAGFDAYRTKPFDPFELRGFLERMAARPAAPNP